MNKSDESQGQSASELISNKIAELGGWRGEPLGRMRKLILQADPHVVEEWKWMGTPVWSHGGIICTGETYKDKVKLTFAKGASLNDPAHLFNASLDGNTRRAIDIHEGEAVDESAFMVLIAQAVALNGSGKSKSAKKAKSLATLAAAPPDGGSLLELFLVSYEPYLGLLQHTRDKRMILIDALGNFCGRVQGWVNLAAQCRRGTFQCTKNICVTQAFTHDHHVNVAVGCVLLLCDRSIHKGQFDLRQKGCHGNLQHVSQSNGLKNQPA